MMTHDIENLRQTTEFCQDEFKRTYISDMELFRLCAERIGRFLPYSRFAIPTILDRIARALERRSPFALMRVGDAEGTAIGMTRPGLHSPMVKGFFQRFLPQNHYSIEISAAIAFCHEVRNALSNADVLGFRAFLDHMHELDLIAKCIGEGKAASALGITYAREFLLEGLSDGLLADKIVTSAWINLDLIPYLEELFSLADRIVVVTGRAGLKGEFEKRLKSRLAKFITVPAQGFVPNSPEESHYCFDFPRVKNELSTELGGYLVLVGAGLFGKIYCDIAKRNGAVAIDLGSAFDALSGLRTRPDFEFYNFEGVAWDGNCVEIPVSKRFTPSNATLLWELKEARRVANDAVRAAGEDAKAREALTSQLLAMETSRSWRMTAPARWLMSKTLRRG